MTRDPNTNQFRVWRAGNVVIDLAAVVEVAPTGNENLVMVRFSTGDHANLSLTEELRKHLADAFEAYLLGYR